MRFVALTAAGVTAGSLVALAASCGGATSSTPGSSGSTSGSDPGGGKACTEIGCDQGMSIAFSYREAGSYVVDLVIDGAPVSCRASIPLARDPATPCDRSDVLLSLVGSMLPVDQQSIGGVRLTSTTAKSVSIRITRDGKVLASATYAPVPWVTRPGPNGPGCEPAQCTAASVALAPRTTPGFACGPETCDVGAQYCQRVEGNGASPSYACVSPSAPGPSTSSGGPLETCGAADCACIERRARATAACSASATCKLVDGNAFVTCTSQ